MRQLTMAFTLNGEVTAKTVEIRDNGTVNCSGVAQSYPALLGTLDKLRKQPGVTKVDLQMVHGKSPMQFTFQFVYNGNGGSNEN